MPARLIRAACAIEGFQPDDTPILHPDGGVLVEDGRVAAIGAFDALRARAPDAELLGGPGIVVMPGLINAHHHVGLTPLQLGAPDDALELARAIFPHVRTFYDGTLDGVGDEPFYRGSGRA
jgi:cytosine/adenosine deaminase-related metal-dependent hydrolase